MKEYDERMRKVVNRFKRDLPAIIAGDDPQKSEHAALFVPRKRRPYPKGTGAGRKKGSKVVNGKVIYPGVEHA